MLGHINDRTLDSLLDGSLNPSTEQAIEAHARHCDGCLQRLREWEILFPDIKRLIPTGEHPVFAPGTPTPRPPSLDVYVPDWSPPPRRPVPTKIIWAVAGVLGAAALYLVAQGIWANHNKETAFYQVDQAPPPATPRVDSAGLGSGMSRKPVTEIQRSDSSGAPPTTTTSASSAEPHAIGAPATPAHPSPATTLPVEQDVRPAVTNREPPVQFPIRAPENPQGSRAATSTDAPGGAPPTSATPAEPTLPSQFSRVTLGDAMNRLAGTVRLIQGLTPEAVEIAPGTLLPGAAPDRIIVRVIYNLPDGRIILDQQRLDHPGSAEPSIAISTTPAGVSIAQWVDRSGFWISLAGRTDQQNLLTIANRVH